MTPEDGEAPTRTQLIIYVFGIIALVIGSGVSAGLQVSLFSIDRLMLRIMSTTSSSVNRLRAKKLLKVLNLEHWTLVALILFNASVMMSLPILLERTFDQLTSLIISITAVLFLAEVIPLSLFVRYAVAFCSALSYVIWAAIIITAPISYPVGKLLDWFFGTNEDLLDRNELAALIAMPKTSDEDEERESATLHSLLASRQNKSTVSRSNRNGVENENTYSENITHKSTIVDIYDDEEGDDNNTNTTTNNDDDNNCCKFAEDVQTGKRANCTQEDNTESKHHDPNLSIVPATSNAMQSATSPLLLNSHSGLRENRETSLLSSMEVEHTTHENLHHSHVFANSVTSKSMERTAASLPSALTIRASYNEQVNKEQEEEEECNKETHRICREMEEVLPRHEGNQSSSPARAQCKEADDSDAEGLYSDTEKPDPFELQESEVKMLQGALQLSTNTIKEHIRTTEVDAFMLSSRDMLDRDTVQLILQRGYNRIPVYFGDDRKHIIGALIVDSLITLCFTNPEVAPLVGDYPLRELLRLTESSSLYDAYMAFRTGTSNMAVVYNSFGLMVGLLTLTDVLAALYHANPDNHVPIPVSYLRRQGKMFRVMKDMKHLHASINNNNINSLSDTVNNANTTKSNNKNASSKKDILSPMFSHSSETLNKLGSPISVHESKIVKTKSITRSASAETL